MGRLRQIFTIDLRALAAFRVALATVLFCDIAIRATSLRAFYSDEGLLPRTSLIERHLGTWQLCVHLINGTVAFQAFLFFLAGVFAVMLFLGYRSRLAALGSWLLLISVQARNPLILQAGDILIRSLLFWAIFLPLDRKATPRESHIRSFGGAALLLQVPIMLIVFSALLKNSPEWYPDGTAISYALQIDFYAKPFGVWLRDFSPGLLKALTLSTWWLELVGPAILFLPICFVFFRILGVVLFIGLHVGLFFSMELGIFPFVSAIAMISFPANRILDLA